LPAFFVATLLVYFLSVKLGLLPTNGWAQGWRYKVLPSFTLGAPSARGLHPPGAGGDPRDHAGGVRRRCARARPPSATRALGTRPAELLLPVLTVVGPMLRYLVTGSFMIEVLFSVPGISHYYVASVLARDYTVVLGITVLLTLMIIVANQIVDIVQAYLDPRIRQAPA
jgi:oligopeptide transport system permease protein